MKKATKKLLISAAVLVVALSLAATSTFAWFTMNNEPEVDGFDVNVTANDGVYISTIANSEDDTVGADGTFKSYVTSDEVIDAIMENSDFVSGSDLKNLTAATTADGNVFEDENGYSMGDAEYTSEDTTHYTFRLYFYSNNAYRLKLNTNDSAVSSNHSANYLPVPAWMEINENDYPHSDLSTPIATGEDIDADAKDAVRLAFDDGSDTNIWDPNPDTGFTDNTEGNLANDYRDHVYGTTTTVESIVANTVDSSEVLLTLTGADDTGYNGYLDISLWIEGWDANCFNTILDDEITTALKFAGEVVA